MVTLSPSYKVLDNDEGTCVDVKAKPIYYIICVI